MNRRRGFSLIELVIVMAALGGAVLAVSIPAINAARGIDASASAMTLALALEEEATRAAADMRGLPTGAGWSASVATLVAASPYVPHPPSTVDGLTRTYRRSVTCVDQTLSTPDPTCAAGFALVAVIVDRSDQTGATATFLATREGL